MSSEKQTLILAGELVPRRGAAEWAARDLPYTASSLHQPLTVVATPVDGPMLIIQGGYQPISVESTASTERGSAMNAANAYARTQGLGRTRTTLIDAYA